MTSTATLAGPFAAGNGTALAVYVPPDRAIGTRRSVGVPAAKTSRSSRGAVSGIGETTLALNSTVSSAFTVPSGIGGAKSISGRARKRSSTLTGMARSTPAPN